MLHGAAVAAQTGFMRLVALCAGQDDSLRLVRAVRLCLFHSDRAAGLSGCFVAGADKGQLFIRGEIRIQCDDRLVCGFRQRSRRAGLQRCKDNSVYTVVVQHGLNHVQLLVVGGCRGGRLDVDLYIRVLAGAGFRARHDLFEVFVCMLDNHRNAVYILCTCRAAAGA